MAQALLRIALAQVLAGTDVDAVIDQAAGKGADIVVFPEMFSNGYSRFDPSDEPARTAWIGAAEPIDGPTFLFCGNRRNSHNRYYGTYMCWADGGRNLTPDHRTTFTTPGPPARLL